ncbi:MAG: PTS transporter subunit EIIC [Synergistaceae bacterium]|nr:PTS transporter subunit EIIC [Synergistaceae bacterium]MBR1657709.1 PTS transporter subunit EIIC [Synergistaceae bacterium]
MTKYLQKIGRSLMLPVACLPAAGILYGIGYWIDPAGWGTNSVIAAFCIKAASAIIDQIPLLFAIGTSIGMAEEHDGASALAGLVSWLMITTLLSTNAVAMYTGLEASEVPDAFGKIQNAFIGILSGLTGATCYNKFKDAMPPEFLAFFSGKRCVAVVTAFVSAALAAVLYYVWPAVYGGLEHFGVTISKMGALGAGIYGMLNRALIPLGLHHALNAVFWFDTIGINDLGKFWAGSGTLGLTGIYMTGFFPVMMFGLVAGAFAMYRQARPERRNVARSLLIAGAFASFFTGITEPLEFSFMFLAPGLYLIHSVLTGISMAVCAYLPVRCGFNFSAGMVDWILSFRAPMALNAWLILPIGLVTAVVYYVVFTWAIKTFNLRTPGREDADDDELVTPVAIDEPKKKVKSDFTNMAAVILEGLGGAENLEDYDYCATRIRVNVKDGSQVDDNKVKSSGALGITKLSPTSIQVVIGTRVQFAFDAMKKLIEASK